MNIYIVQTREPGPRFGHVRAPSAAAAREYAAHYYHLPPEEIVLLGEPAGAMEGRPDFGTVDENPARAATRAGRNIEP